MDKCEKCGYEHFNFERCPETYYFKHGWWGDDWQEIGAYDYDEAAEKVAAMINEDEPETGEIIKRIPIANKDRTDIRYFSVEAEYSLDYYSTEIEINEENDFLEEYMGTVKDLYKDQTEPFIL